MEATIKSYKALTRWLNGLTGAAKYLAWSLTGLIMGAVLAVATALSNRADVDYRVIVFATFLGAVRAFWFERRRKSLKPSTPQKAPTSDT
jgi:hypothetical protein